MKSALRFPIIISHNTKLRVTKGSVRFTCPIKFGLVRIGFKTCGLVDYPNDRAIWEMSGSIVFNGSAYIGAASKILVGSGKLILGQGVMITGRTAIICHKEIIIGSESLISWDCLIMDTDWHDIFDNGNLRLNPDREISIGEHVWIGARCCVLKGSVIPANSIVAAGTTVSKVLQNQNVIYGGNPCHVIKKDIYWER